ncbi:sarcosine oxidase subunit alpha family protein [Zavarzinia sp.]|uniref:sarcosine oxidase subunit alpha family protein n=1 Tax=Zavarzinia sp. TaxID=2027920 RepID=UPI003562FE31
MSNPFRLALGGRIDRKRPLSFSFDGKSFQGYAGDTLASALIANGVHLVGRSFKYHRPRGFLAAGSDEPNAMVAVKRDTARVTPNTRATGVELYDGLTAESQNRWPSLAFDAGAVNDLLSPFFPAGFYYKTFMWPAGAWKRFYEPKIRAMAGLGVAPKEADPDRYLQRHAHCDVLVVGAGPAGLAAALAASDTGARVILADEQSEMGGSLLADDQGTIDGKPAGAWIAEALALLGQRDNVTLLARTTAFGFYGHNHLGLCERVTDHLAAPDPKLPRERLWQVRAKQVVAAAGAIERPLVFPDNDRPGIMLADAAHCFVTRYGAKPGSRALIATAGDDAYRAALALHAAGVEIAAIADLRETVTGPLPEAARALGLKILTGSVVTGTRGRLRVSGATVAPAKGGAGSDIACDLIAMSGGFTPSLHLHSQARGKLVFDAASGNYLPGESLYALRSAGACKGVTALADVLADGFVAGTAAAEAAGFAAGSPRSLAVSALDARPGGFAGALPHGRDPNKVKAFVDFQNDACAKDIVLATREGFRSIEHVKRYTTTGMATDQGKTSNINALNIVSAALERPVPEVGLTTFRPPYTPTTFGIFAGTARGDLFEPVRRTPIDPWAAGQGAVFEDVGQWKRARYFPVGSEDMEAAVARECRAVRSAAGIFDATTLGKIEVVGPDAAEFLNRIYTNAWTKLEVGRCRYGVMLREDGFLLDDGVVGRIAADRFHVTTTTGGAAAVLHRMEDYLQTEWPDLDCWLTSQTEEWAVIAVQGPKARAVIEPLVEDIDLDPEAMPHMSVRLGKILGVPMRLFRVSFTGELGFEINVPSSYGRKVWEAVFAAGQAHGITPYGTEAMHVLRAEKGYIIVGQETDGTVAPDDLGLGWAIAKAKKDFVGKRSLARAEMRNPTRKQMVGLESAVLLEEGAQIVADPTAPLPLTALGHVTSSYHSAVLGKPIALALVSGGRARLGETLHVPMPGGAIAVKLVSPVFYDPEGVRLDA